MSYVAIPVVTTTTVKNPDFNPELEQQEALPTIVVNRVFDVLTRPEMVAAVNDVVEAPAGSSAKSVIYFTADSGMKPILSAQSARHIVEVVLGETVKEV